MYDNLVIKKKKRKKYFRQCKTMNKRSENTQRVQRNSKQKPQIARSPSPHSPSILHAAPCDTLLFHDVSFSPTTSPCFLQLTSLSRVTCQPCTCCMVFSSLSLKLGICNFAFPQCLAQQSCADSLAALSRRWYRCKKTFHPVQNRMLNRMKCRGVWSREQVFCSHWERNRSQSGGKDEVSKTLNLFLWYVL